MRPNDSYSPELRKPGLGVDVTSDAPHKRLWIVLQNAWNAAACRLWRCPDGVVRKRVRFAARDGHQLSAWLLEPAGQAQKRLPCVLYCHGGAFFFSIYDSNLTIGAVLARELGCRVLLPQYRLSLTHPYPTGQQDCEDALLWLLNREDVDRARLLLYGDSAGGCLAAQTAVACRDRGYARPLGQMLIYPVTDRAGDYPSLKSYAHGTWSTRANENMWRVYLRRAQPADGCAVPMEQPELTGLAPAYVEAAEMDALCDQALAYAEKLEAAGVPTCCTTVPGAYHGYDGDQTSALVQRVMKDRLLWLRQQLQSEAVQG